MIAPPSGLKPGKVWRFPVHAHAGSQDIRDMRCVEVLVPPGQDQFLFAARFELVIPGVAPMAYINDSRPTMITYWFDEGAFTARHY